MTGPEYDPEAWIALGDVERRVFDCGPTLADDYVRESHRYIEALVEAADRGTLGVALDALGPETTRGVLLGQILQAVRTRRFEELTKGRTLSEIVGDEQAAGEDR